MILLIDNYDSFTYNLYQAVRALGADCRVVRNDALTVAQILRLGPEGIILSPGPGRPEDAGVTVEVIRALACRVPMLGVCLGHQAIGLAFGGRVVRAKRLMHGKTCRIRHDGRGVFRGVPQGAEVMRYHSLVVERPGFPKDLEVTARTSEGLVMGLRHRSYPMEGVQFHPESVMTRDGARMIANFLDAKHS
jgi:anthranilate synthase/aminodeoxychorismate synthase-like glutamine amidotransferase